MSQDPHDQLLLQIRGAVAEYERTLITERMRRGRQAKIRAGELLPWTNVLYGYRADPERPRSAAALRLEPVAAAVVRQLFAWYLEPRATLHSVAKRLSAAGIPTPFGKQRWHVASVRSLLRNPAYTGTAYTNRTREVAARRRKSALLPVGPGKSQVPRPREEWIPIPVPALIAQEDFDLVQEKLAQNQQGARRHNTSHAYLVRALISCGACQLRATARTVHPGYHYYVCTGRTDGLRIAEGRRCTARFIPADRLDALIWSDRCAVLTAPEHLETALTRAQGGHWLPQELQSRQASLRQAVSQLARQQQRVLDAYVAGVVELAAFEQKQQELRRRQDALAAQERQLAGVAQQRRELSAVATGLTSCCDQVRAGLATATFDQRRALVELLIERVVVTDGAVEIRYVFPTTRDGPHYPFCQLRKDYRAHVPLPETDARLAYPAGPPPRAGRPPDLARPRRLHAVAPRPRWSPIAACPGSARIRRVASPPTACAGRFRHCCSRSARPPACHNPAAARPDGRKATAPAPHRATRPSRRPPDACANRATLSPRRCLQSARLLAWLNHKVSLRRQTSWRREPPSAGGLYSLVGCFNPSATHAHGGDVGMDGSHPRLATLATPSPNSRRGASPL